MAIDRYFKHSEGYVTQLFERNDEGEFECVNQNFTSGNSVEYTNESGQPIDPPDDEGYRPFDMMGQKTPPIEFGT